MIGFPCAVTSTLSLATSVVVTGSQAGEVGLSDTCWKGHLYSGLLELETVRRLSLLVSFKVGTP